MGRIGAKDGGRPEPASARPTIEDVAREARVSRQTVSNVINAPERVSEQTRRETEAAIERLGYRSNAIARNLRQRSSRLIGYRVPAAQRGALHPVLDGFLHALTTAARAEGNSVLLFVPDEEADEAAVHEEMLRTSAVDGLVLTDTTRLDPRIEFLASRELPFVSFGRTELGIPHSWVDVDGASATAAAVRHLAERGHRRIAYLGPASAFGFDHDRRRGYAEGIATAGLELDPALDAPVADDLAAATATRGMLALDPPATAAVASTDALALGAFAAPAPRAHRGARRLRRDRVRRHADGRPGGAGADQRAPTARRSGSGARAFARRADQGRAAGGSAARGRADRQGERLRGKRDRTRGGPRERQPNPISDQRHRDRDRRHVRVFAAPAAARGGSGEAGIERSTSEALAEKRYVAAGDRAYVIGAEDERSRRWAGIPAARWAAYGRTRSSF